jgi:uncharacterized protein
MDWSGIDWNLGVALTAGPMSYGLVDATPETGVFWEKLAAEKAIYFKRCQLCGRANHPRSVVCARCHAESADLEWQASSQLGTVYSFSTIHHAAFASMADQVPYTLGIVMLEEGFPLFARISSADDQSVAIGVTVHASAALISGKWMPVFAVQKSL